MFYACLDDPRVSLAEIRAGLNQPVAIFCYRARRIIRMSTLGEPIHHPQLTKDEMYKLNLFEDFLYEEFTREVGKGTEHLYRTSEMIAKWWFDLPEQDAWAYPSVQSRPKLNVVFRPNKSRECLHLEGAMIGKISFDGRFHVDAVAVLEGGQFAYHAFGTEVQRRFLPWLSPRL